MLYLSQTTKKAMVKTLMERLEADRVVDPVVADVRETEEKSSRPAEGGLR